MDDSFNWLDTQTKAELQKRPPEKLAPADVAGYSLVLLERGDDLEWVNHVVKTLVDDNADAYAACPLVVRRNLSLEDAMIGQFELICANSISIFLRDSVVQSASPAYLRELYDDLRNADEFKPVAVLLKSVPDTEEGRKFLRQFFGQFLGIETLYVVARKKARVMAHWGAKLGAAIELVDLPA